MKDLPKDYFALSYNGCPPVIAFGDDERHAARIFVIAALGGECGVGDTFDVTPLFYADPFGREPQPMRYMMFADGDLRLVRKDFVLPQKA